MKSRARCLMDKATDAMLSAIELYNKPNFPYREEAFAILAVNAWELLLKARLMLLSNNKVAAILAYERRSNSDGTTSIKWYRKKNRSGNYLTVGLFEAYDRLTNDLSDTLHASLRANLEALVEVRDNSVHYYNRELELTKRIQEIAAANLKNFMNCVRQWFGVDLSTYNIFLIPLAFIRDVAPIEGMNLNSEEKHLLKYLTKLADEKSNEPDADFSVTLPIEIRVKRSKEKGASSFIISDAPDAIPVKLEEENIREKYPWDYIVLTKRLESRYSDFKINEKYHKIRRPLEADTRFCMVRLLDPGNPKSSQKKFYNSNILKQFDEHYVRKGAV